MVIVHKDAAALFLLMLLLLMLGLFFLPAPLDFLYLSFLLNSFPIKNFGKTKIVPDTTFLHLHLSQQGAFLSYNNDEVEDNNSLLLLLFAMMGTK